MDGRKKRLSGSLRARLLLTLSLLIVAAAGLAGALSFGLAYRDARALQDILLQQVGAQVAAQAVAPVLLPPDPYFADKDDDARLIVQRLGEPNPEQRHVDEGGALPVPTSVADGLHTLTLDGESFRVLVGTGRGGQRFVVAQETDFGEHMALASALRTTLPLLLLIPLLLWAVARVLARVFGAVSTLAAEVDRRGEEDLHPVAHAPVPLELRPFILAINRLLGRVAEAMQAQRRFVADATHELRSPLAALSLQAERLAQAPMSTLAQERLATLRGGIARSRALLQQLLELARAQATAGRPDVAVSLQAVCRQVLADLLPLAERKHIDLGLLGDEATGDTLRVDVYEAELAAIVRNLLDNAIRYTPAGGRVDLSVTRAADGVRLCVADTGPGIAPAERERVLDRFYRVLGSGQTGSGLGLSIVQTIVQRLGAELLLAYADPVAQRGLKVVVTLPAGRVDTTGQAR